MDSVVVFEADRDDRVDIQTEAVQSRQKSGQSSRRYSWVIEGFSCGPLFALGLKPKNA
jgi:hypothetical protein